MKKRPSTKEIILVASTLFGMFFGAGNLIFPVYLGQIAGKNVIPAMIGFCITAVSIPILGVAAIGNTHSDDLYDLSKRVSPFYGLFFTCLLYLTIGPLFALPRCATTSFSAGVFPLLQTESYGLSQFVFSLIFFLLVLFFSLRPNGIMTWIGKIINPLFLVFYLFLVIIALLDPSTSIGTVLPIESYQEHAFFQGILEGYGTMDAIAGLAFGVVVVEMIKKLDIKEDGDIAGNIIFSGIFTAIGMVIIYALSILMGAQSRGVFAIAENGGVALAQIANHYLGNAGSMILACAITLACLKTAIGLVTSCGEMFHSLFPKWKYTSWVFLFVGFSFVISNVGLTSLISYSVPVLMFLYPLAIVLILLALLEKKFGFDESVYRFVILFTLLPAFFDFLKALPFGIDVSFASKIFPFFDLGFGWIVPAILGLAVSLMVKRRERG